MSPLHQGLLVYETCASIQLSFTRHLVLCILVTPFVSLWEHNIFWWWGWDHSELTQNRTIQPGFQEYWWLPRAIGTVLQSKQCSSRFCRMPQAKGYFNFCHRCHIAPTAPSVKTYTQLSTILKNHFAPKTLVIAERYRFHNCTQCEGESISTFAVNLKHLASTC